MPTLLANYLSISAVFTPLFSTCLITYTTPDQKPHGDTAPK
jgi:hypothetical protein